MGVQPITELEQGWTVVQKLFRKLEGIVESKSNNYSFTSDEYMEGYNTIYNLCSQYPPHDYSHQVYDRYRETLEAYLSSTVVPCLREKCGEPLLEELVQRWSNHKIMVGWLVRFFHYLDRHFVPRNSLPTLREAGIHCFNLVWGALYGEVLDAVITVVEQERGGDKIDRALYNFADVIPLMNQERDEGDQSRGALLKNVADMYLAMYS